jgi:long-chain acyl-CoA synthetase
VLNRVANGIATPTWARRGGWRVYAENSVETVLAHLGGLLAGTSTVPVILHLTADEAAFMHPRLGRTGCCSSAPRTSNAAARVAARAGEVRVIAWRSPSAPEQWETWLAAASSAEPPHLGRPAAEPDVHERHHGCTEGRGVAAADVRRRDHHRRAPRGHWRRDRFAQLGTHLVVGPMYHTGPLSGMRLLAVGVPVVVLGRFDAERVLQAIETHRIETTVMVPTHFKRLLELPADVRAGSDVSSLKLVAHTGAACPVDVKHDMITWFGPVFTDAYGSTEVGTICSISSQEWLEHPGSVGRCIPPFTRAIVVDEDGSGGSTWHRGAAVLRGLHRSRCGVRHRPRQDGCGSSAAGRVHHR